MEVSFHDVGVYYLHIVIFCKSFCKDRHKPVVNFDSHHLVGTLGKLVCENAYACAYLDYAEAFFCIAHFGYLGANGGIH